MKKPLFLFVALISFATTISAQSDSAVGTFSKPKPRNYEVKHVIFELSPVVRTGARLWCQY